MIRIKQERIDRWYAHMDGEHEETIVCDNLIDLLFEVQGRPDLRCLPTTVAGSKSDAESHFDDLETLYVAVILGFNEGYYRAEVAAAGRVEP